MAFISKGSLKRWLWGTSMQNPCNFPKQSKAHNSIQIYQLPRNLELASPL